MQQDKFIFLDMDGVLVDFTQGIIDYFDLTVTTQAFTSWDSVYPLTGFTPAELWAQLGYDFWVDLKFIEEAPAILSMTSEFKPVLLSMPPQLNLSTYMAKAAWIKRNLPNFFYEGRLLLGGTKFQIAGPGKLLIDDSDALVEDWRAYGGSAILVPRPWNKKRGQSVFNAIRIGLNLFSEGDHEAIT